MLKHQRDPDALPLRTYFQSVITWVQGKFTYRKGMKGIDWGFLYNDHKDKTLDPAELEKEISRLMQYDDVTNKKGVYAFVLDGKEKHLNIRGFSDNMKREAYERQKGIYPVCNKHFEMQEMEGDHINPRHSGGKTNAANCQMLCKECNRRKSGK
jgi:ABC-type cobalamin/Fe3+-siderophores transport system ATPase subunit